MPLTEADIQYAASVDPEVRAWAKLNDTAWASFHARPDRPDLFDEQEGYLKARDIVSVLVAGNFSGKTEVSAAKCANFVLHQQPPPRHDTPFWIISESYAQTCGVCWKEKLYGHGHIPESEVDWLRVTWIDKRMEWPASVPLKPWPGMPGKNWTLEFKSFEQGWKKMSAFSIGGFWFSEQFPLTLMIEVLRGCRDYMYLGGQFAEFTPLDPDLCMWIEKLMERPPRGWRFYRCNSECNRENLADGFVDQFISVLPEEIRETRLRGQLAVYEGIIYETFSPAIHVVDDDRVDPGRRGVMHYRSTDFGASVEHPWVTLWGFRDGLGDWAIYDEYWSNDQRLTVLDHAIAIRERWPWPATSPYHHQNYADPSRPDLINMLNVLGITTLPAANNVDKGINCIRSLLKVNEATRRPRLYIHRRCAHLIEEMRKYRWKRGNRPTEGHYLNPSVAKQVPLKRDDDACDAERYMVFSVENSYGLAPGSLRRKPEDQVHESVQLALAGAGQGFRHGVPFTGTRRGR
jgi:hypothetical protein